MFTGTPPMTAKWWDQPRRWPDEQICVVYAHDGTFFSHKEQQYYATFRRMTRTGNHYIKLDNLGTERQVSPLYGYIKISTCLCICHPWRTAWKKETEGQKGRGEGDECGQSSWCIWNPTWQTMNIYYLKRDQQQLRAMKPMTSRLVVQFGSTLKNNRTTVKQRTWSNY